MSNFFYIFPNLFFSKTNNAKIIPLIIFSHYYYYFYYTKKCKIVQKKEGCMNMYGHILYIIIHFYTFMNIYACLCMFIHVYTYSCMKNFLLSC